MEIYTISIPKNDYNPNKEIRPEVVQGICEAFLSSNVWNTFHPIRDGRYRGRTRYIMRHKGDKKFYGFNSNTDIDVCVKFNSCELKKAVDILIRAGYYIHEIYSYGTWLGYVCSKYPTIQNGRNVTEVYITEDFNE